MKRRILFPAMAACLALSMMLTLSACGKKNPEEYFNIDTIQKLVISSVEQYKPQGMELKVYAEGDGLHYDLTLTTIETTDGDRSVYAEALETGLAETAQIFVGAAKGVQRSAPNGTVLMVVTYFDAAGMELASQFFSSADWPPIQLGGRCIDAAPLFSYVWRELRSISARPVLSQEYGNSE